ncbi:HAD family hydrolase [Desulfovibrio sp. OttesenSCG-928-C06]|nr:HAD family hydrolase [Desulfovibrio sp. OttesenSCG-928-C06]
MQTIHTDIYSHAPSLLETFHGLKGIIFDCDGVLLDSRKANIAFYNYIRDCLDLPPLLAEQEEYVHMATFEQALNYIVPEEQRGHIPDLLDSIESYLDYYSLLTVEEGLLDMLDWLKLQDIHLGICTNRIDPMDGLLGRFKLNGYFQPIQTASNSQPKPHPDGLLQVLRRWNLSPAEVAFIGDSKVDESAAKGAGVPFWAFKNETLNAALHIPGFSTLHGWLLEYAEKFDNQVQIHRF